MRTILALLFTILAAAASAAYAQPATSIEMYKNPQCGCCAEYAKYLEQNGFEVTIKETSNLESIKRQAGVPSGLEACHTMLVDKYVVEGHVPVDTLNRLLTERPEIRGIALPGMPMGSPGMSGTKAEPFTIYAFSDGEPTVYAKE